MTFELPEPFSPLEILLHALHESRAAHRCPYLNGVGTCVTGCGSLPSPEPRCITDCPDARGWQSEIMSLELLVARDLAADDQRYAGGCWRQSPRRAMYHPLAPQGLSFCHGCRRVVVRGQGRWWE